MAVNISINGIFPIRKEKCMRYVMRLAMPAITAISKFVTIEQKGK